MRNKPEKNQSGKVNYVWVLAGGYLIYLAYKLFRGAIAGEAPVPVFGVASGVLFVAVGAYLLYREWKAYKFGAEHIDDPTTWNDEEEDSELEWLMEASKKLAKEKEEASEETPEEQK